MPSFVAKGVAESSTTGPESATRGPEGPAGAAADDPLVGKGLAELEGQCGRGPP